MYESPIMIEFSNPVFEQLRDEADEYILKACQMMVASVDKDELVKALQYDRDQYFKGFEDGKLWKPPIVTNADRIRSMSDEKLADYLRYDCPHDNVCIHTCDETECVDCWLDWLREEAAP